MMFYGDCVKICEDFSPNFDVKGSLDFPILIIISFRFFIEIASDCETVDQASHSMSFISDANILALHRLLWNHQEKIGDYLSSSRDHKAVGRRPFDKMATLLAYLGPPEHKPVDSQ
jgi:neurofibromin 1